jgi:hypothetical protein
VKPRAAGGVPVVMRLVAMVACLGACTIYDPVDEIPHAEYATTRQAVRAILGEEPVVQVYAIGEYHPTRVVAARSPLARFTNEIIELLQPGAQHLVVESWLRDQCRSSEVAQIDMQVLRVTNRAPAQASELQRLIATSRGLAVETHGLPITCIEHASVLDGRGNVDFLRLLMLVTEKLSDTTHALLAQGRSVIVYGGALHNDLYPAWPLEDLSYARPLAGELGGGVLELDLVVPEIVAPMAMIRREGWFPLLGRASPDRVIVWERGPGSYVVILPALDGEVAKLARPIAMN